MGFAFISLMVLFCILVAIAIGALVYSIFHHDNPILNAATQGYSSAIKDLGLIFIGAFIAVITSALSTFFTMDLTTTKTREDTIIGFYYELKALDEKIKHIPIDTHTKCLSYIIQNKIHLYTDSGLYFVFKKEIFSLENSILEKILDLYPKILLIDEITDLNPQTHGSLELLKIHDHIVEIKIKISELIKILEEEKKKIG